MLCYQSFVEGAERDLDNTVFGTSPTCLTAEAATVQTRHIFGRREAA